MDGDGLKAGFHGGTAVLGGKNVGVVGLENCQVIRGCNAHAITQIINVALIKMSYHRPVTISVYGDTNGLPSSVQRFLSSTGISLNHVPDGVKDASDKKILVDMLFWAVDNPAPANYLLISGDKDFSSTFHQLWMSRYNISLAQPFKASLLLLLLPQICGNGQALLLEDLHKNLLLVPTNHVKNLCQLQFWNLYQQTNLLIPMPIPIPMLMLPGPQVYLILYAILILKLFIDLRTRIN